MNPREQEWLHHIDDVRIWCSQRRGRQSQLAAWLHVRRQAVSRWLQRPNTMPPWAAVHTNIWYHRHHVPPQADKPEPDP